MEAKEYLREVAAILESEAVVKGDVAYIRIHDETAKEIASNLREIADKIPAGILH